MMATIHGRKEWEYRGFRVLPISTGGWEFLPRRDRVAVHSRTKAGVRSYLDKLIAFQKMKDKHGSN